MPHRHLKLGEPIPEALAYLDELAAATEQATGTAGLPRTEDDMGRVHVVAQGIAGALGLTFNPGADFVQEVNTLVDRLNEQAAP